MLTAMGLTAARYDLLYALMKRRSGIAQCKLQRKLGVSRATVSRMLGSLEKLGLVERRRDDVDRRRKYVTLTALGRARIVLAHKDLARSGWVQLAIDTALGGEGPQEPWYRGPCEATMGALDHHLDALRRGFYDTGHLDYPRWCQDFDPEDRERNPPWKAWQDGEGVV
jgi:DNA-binding MarR family transcriptional regulator